MSYRCLIVDDEPLARDLLVQFINQLPSLSLVGSCADALTGLTVLHTEPVDILFTDIKMPQLSGIDLIRALTSPPRVILTTAFADYALDGFELGVVDYLVKPFSFTRFLRAVDRVLDRSAATDPVTPPPILTSAFLFLKVDKKIVKVWLSDILYGQAYGNYVKVYLRDGRMLLVTETMIQLEKLLPADQFIRIHKSYIVALADVTEYQSSMLYIGSVPLPIGDSYRRQFMEAVG